MPILLYRVDERLIHGQVVVGWGNSLKLDQIVLANDQVASNKWERELYLACVPPEMKPVIVGVDQAAQAISSGSFEPERTMVLVDSPFDLLVFLRQGVKIKSVNVGGMHSKTGRQRILPYLFMSPEEIAAFRTIMSAGVECECRDVPLAEKHDLAALFDKLRI
jgi:mannose/fructose/N-acetylgalactosamine-specific phosphotransferase system component IIB